MYARLGKISKLIFNFFQGRKKLILYVRLSFEFKSCLNNTNGFKEKFLSLLFMAFKLNRFQKSELHHVGVVNRYGLQKRLIHVMLRWDNE